MILVDEGTLRLEEPVDRLLPERSPAPPPVCVDRLTAIVFGDPIGHPHTLNANAAPTSG